ncbi:MAG: thioesterase family protein [Actinomycetales bacterium]
MARVKLDYSQVVFCYSTTMDVRFDDINIGYHLGNDRLVSLLGEARSRFLESRGLSELGSPGVIVSDLVVQYKAEGRLRDRLRFDIGIADPNRYGGDIVYRVVREAHDQATASAATGGSAPAHEAEPKETIIALAKTGIVFYDYQQARVCSAPDAFFVQS